MFVQTSQILLLAAGIQSARLLFMIHRRLLSLFIGMRNSFNPFRYLFIQFGAEQDGAIVQTTYVK